MLLQGPKSLINYVKIDAHLLNIHPKSTKMVARSAPKATLGASRVQVALKGIDFVRKIWIFGAMWAILSAKGLPKSNILAPGSIKSRTNYVVKNRWNFDRKIEAWEVQDH